MGKATDRPGGVHRVYLSVEREGALQAFREDNGMPAVNAILLALLVPFLEEKGYLLPQRTMGRSEKSHDEREGHDSSD